MGTDRPRHRHLGCSVSIARKRKTARRRTAPQEDAAWWEAANVALFARSGGLCEHCGTPLNGRVERHHRQRRQVGGDRLSNLLYLLPEHHTYITEHPTEAMANGFIVSTHGPGGVAPNPEEVPVRLFGRMLWLLDDHGGKSPVP